MGALQKKGCTELLRRYTAASLATWRKVISPIADGAPTWYAAACNRPFGVVGSSRVNPSNDINFFPYSQAFERVWQGVRDLVKGTACEEYVNGTIYK